jgi:hypothetical protein
MIARNAVGREKGGGQIKNDAMKEGAAWMMDEKPKEKPKAYEGGEPYIFVSYSHKDSEKSAS